MALDPSIILQAGRGITPLLSNAEIEDQKMQREGNALKLNSLRQSYADDQSARDIARSTAPEGLAGAYYRAGLVKPAQEAQKFQTEQQKAARDAEKAKLETAIRRFETIGQIMSGVKDQPSYDLARQQVADIVGPESMANIPAVYDPQTVARNQQQAMSVKDQMEQKWKAMQYMTPTASAVLQANTSRANNADTLAIQRDRLNFEMGQPKGQVVQTDSGTMLVDQRTGEARPVTAGGVPVQKPGKDIPANINKSIIENQQNISKIDKAMESIQARPGSLSPLFALPGSDMAGQYFDPKGVEARAGVADIGSLILHDRSGAAVTASETPRLKPFIPQASDTAEVALKKLQRFKQIYEEEAGLLAQTYSKDQGYKESPVLKQGSSAKGMAGAKAGGAQRITDKAAFDALPSGTLFIAPDGTTRRKP